MDHQLPDRQAAASEAGKFSSSTRTISTGAPQGCVLSPHLTLNVEHTTLFTLFIHPTYLFFISICTYQTCTHIIVYIIYCVFAIFVHCLFVYLYIILLLSVSCPVAVILLPLWSFCHYNKFLICVNNIPGQ